MDKKRVFIAIGLHVGPSLTQWVKTLKKLQDDERLNWTNKKQWHLTLKFIGEITKPEVKILAERLFDAFKKAEGGKLLIKGAGFFGPSRAPKVIWAGIENDEWLKKLNQISEEVCSTLGIPESPHPFAPHLTLARMKGLKHPTLLLEEIQEKKETLWHETEVRKVTLYESQLTSDGPVYSELEQFELQIANGR
ncbi:RNA 2',3'-cyclic phosphodiesterase [Marinilabilia sp.]|uniref:RNA 2',3'-cyclic phosphodiesterase n=1 Tax=Marinilabilia sp. TaxID=2021252 RepID=UPI0025BD238A|nr:RNA 2',3'-cyclic phosphodiesterase [Marinilabilia sp.]